MAWEDPQPRARPPDPRGLAHLAPGRPGSPAQPLKPRLPGKPCRPCGPAGPGLVASCAISGLKLSTLVISRSSASSAAVAISRRISRSVAASSPNNAFDRSLLSLTRLTRRLILFICAAYSGGYRPGEPSSSPQKMVPWPLMELKSAAPKRALPASPCTVTTTTAATNTATAAIAIAAAAPAAHGRLLRSSIPCEAPPAFFFAFGTGVASRAGPFQGCRSERRDESQANLKLDASCSLPPAMRGPRMPARARAPVRPCAPARALCRAPFSGCGRVCAACPGRAVQTRRFLAAAGRRARLGHGRGPHCALARASLAASWHMEFAQDDDVRPPEFAACAALQFVCPKGCGSARGEGREDRAGRAVQCLISPQSQQDCCKKWCNLTSALLRSLDRCAAKGKPDPQIDPKEASAKSPAKPALHMLALSATGVAGDYNQYRSEVLRGDPARAVSILTVDVMQALRQEVKISRPPALPNSRHSRPGTRM